jgi:hypothetical protein
MLAEVGAPARPRGRRTRRGAFAGHVLAGEHDHLFHAPGAAPEQRLDLAELDAVAPQLHLVIEATAYSSTPSAASARDRPVFVQAAPSTSELRTTSARGLVTKRSAVSESGARSSPSRAVAADVQLAQSAHGHGAQQGSTHVELRVGDGPADGHARRAARAHGLHGGPDGGLGGAEHVPDRLRAGDERVGEGPREGLATAQDHEARLPCPARVEQQAEGGGRRLEDGRARGAQALREERAVGLGLAIGEIDERAHGERQVELQTRDVEGEARHGEQAIALAETGLLRHRGHEIHEGAVVHQHALRRARRARGVDGVRHAVGGRAAVEGRVALRRDGVRVGVEEHTARRARVHLTGEGAVADEQRGLRVLQDELDARLGIGRIERDIRAARLQDRQQRYHHGGAPFDEEADERPDAHTPRGEVTGEAVRAGVELGVGDDLVPEGQRGAGSVGPRVGAEGIEQARFAWVRGGRRVPVHEHRGELARREQRQVADGELGRLHDAAQQRLQVIAQPLDGGRVEQRRRVLEGAHEPVRRLGEGEREIHLGGDLLGGQAIDGHAAPGGERLGRVLQRE